MQGIDQKTYLDVFREKLCSLQKLVQDLERGLAPPKPDEFIKGLRLIIKAVETFLSRRMDNLQTALEKNPDALAAQITFHAKVALQILGSLHEQYLPLLHAESQHNEYLFKPSIDRAVGLFTKSGFELTLIPDFQYNYAFEGKENFATREVELLERHSDPDTKAALVKLRKEAALKQWIVFLHFPVAERDSALKLCILAHELGHFVDETNKIYRDLLPIELDKDSFEQLVDAKGKTPAYGGVTPKSAQQLTFDTIFTRAGVEALCYRSCNEMLERWIREIIADILAAHAIGPASYFAFNDFLACMGAENATSNSHPAPAFRLQLILKELKDTMGYMNSASAIDSVLSEAIPRVAAGAVDAKYRDEAKVVHKTIDSNLASLLAKIRPVVSEYSFGASNYRSTVPKILERLRRGIAPIEVLDEVQGEMSAASVVGILNAGWELYKTDTAGFYGEFKDTVPELERLGNLNHLLFKAVEASDVKRRWK